jgi:hypothetical protein
MVITQTRFEKVREGPMPDVVNQSGGKKRRSSAVDLGVIVVLSQALQDLLHHMQHAQAMRKPVVVGARVGQVADTQLMDSSQPLKLGAVK